MGGYATVKNEFPGLFAGQGLSEQVVEIQNLDTAFLHLQYEVVMILLCLLDPDHVVEEQITAIAGRQPLMCEARPTHHHGA